MSNKKSKTKQSLLDVFKELASKAFNYPTTDMCSDGDVCTYLKHITVGYLRSCPCRYFKLSTNVNGQFCKYLVMCSCGLIAESSI